jgi:anti-anti-sigma factor
MITSVPVPRDSPKDTRKDRSYNVFSVKTRLTRSTLDVRVAGALDMATVPELEDSLAPYDGRAQEYHFFLDRLRFVDVVGWKAIARRCSGNRGKIVSASSSVRRMIDLLGIGSPSRAS